MESEPEKPRDSDSSNFSVSVGGSSIGSGLFASFKSASKRRSSTILSAFDLVLTHQTILNTLRNKYLSNDEHYSLVVNAFNDHAMNKLTTKSISRQISKPNVCPMHNNEFVSSASTNNENISERRMNKTCTQSSIVLVPKKSFNSNINHHSENHILSKLILERGLILDAFGPNNEDISVWNAQCEIKWRDQNKMMGDSFAHFLRLYFDAIWTDSKVLKGTNVSDQIVVERYLRYLRILHNDYLTGNILTEFESKITRNCHKNNMLIDEKNDDNDKEENENENDNNDEDIINPSLNINNAIRMDEYRIFVEYMCECLETNVMRKHPSFRANDLMLISSLRYHLSKLSLMLLGEIPIHSIIKSQKQKASALKRFVTLSAKTIHKLKTKLGRNSKSYPTFEEALRSKNPSRSSTRPRLVRSSQTN